MKKKIFIFLLLACSSLFSTMESSIGDETDHPRDLHENSSEVSETSVGQEMAVRRASRDQGFILSEAAWKRLGIRVASLKNAPPFSIPSSALVYYQDQIGVFRFREGWFRLVPIKILSQSSDHLQITSQDLQKDDAVATQGVGFLRVTEMEVFGEAKGGHVH